jgi:hypothetical protein
MGGKPLGFSAFVIAAGVGIADIPIWETAGLISQKTYSIFLYSRLTSFKQED